MKRQPAEHAALDHLDRVLRDYRAKGEWSSSPIPDENVIGTIAAVRAVVARVAGAGSSYSREVERVLAMGKLYEKYRLPGLIGVVTALREDVAAGALRSLQEIHHAEVFGDYLEMASHLLAEGYKDPAAVLTGSSLEAHLRQLAVRFAIIIEKPDGSAKKADALNAELAQAEVYNRLDQKSVTAWLDLRNKAAHGQYGEYSREQVALMLTSVRDFMSRNPA